MVNASSTEGDCVTERLESAVLVEDMLIEEMSEEETFPKLAGVTIKDGIKVVDKGDGYEKPDATAVPRPDDATLPRTLLVILDIL